MPPTKAAAYSVADVARRFDVGAATVLAWIRSGELLAVNVSRSARSKKPRFRVSEAALLAFEAARMPTPPAPHTRRQRASNVVEFY